MEPELNEKMHGKPIKTLDDMEKLMTIDDPGELEKEAKKEDCLKEFRPIEEEATRKEKEDLESLDINAAIDKVLARLEAENVTGDHQGIQAADDETNIKGSDFTVSF